MNTKRNNKVVFKNVDDALSVLVDISKGPEIHMKAIRYLSDLVDCFEAKNLVYALDNEDPGVRWEAANLLARLGDKAVPAILRALMDPKWVRYARLREGVIHIIHLMSDYNLQYEFSPLLQALTGSAVDVETMWEAYRLFVKINPKECPEAIEKKEYNSKIVK